MIRFDVRLVWVVLPWLLAGCQTYRVNQTSLVPAAILTPPVAFKPGFDASATVGYGMGTGVRTRAGEDSSLWVSRGTLTTALEYSGRVVGGRLQVFHGLNAGASRATENNLGKPSGHVWGIGPSMLFRALEGHPHQRFTFDAGLLFVVAPSIVQAVCIDCGPGEQNDEGSYVDRSVALMVSTGLSHRILLDEKKRLIWGINLQTSVTNRYENDRNIPGRSKVNMGAPHPTFAFGLEWSAADWATLQPALAWIAPPAPAIYLPTIMLSVRFGVPTDRDEASEDEPETGLSVFDQNLAHLQR